MEETPLYKTSQIGSTDIWNDSCSVEELEYSIANGAVGATTNPSIVLYVLKKEMHLWKDRIEELIREMPEATEDDIAWCLIEEMAAKGAGMLYPIFEQEKGKKGRISIQTNAKNYRNPQKLVEQAVHFDTIAPNVQVKIPATAAGIKAIEEATYCGVNINATVSFTVPQAIAVAEAVERGLQRREKENLSISTMTPVCTIMVGRLDDWLKAVKEKTGQLIDPECYEWAGVAVAKHAYELYKERGYRTRLLFGALRNHYHWSEFIGADVILTITNEWQKRINASSLPVEEKMDKPVKKEYIDTLLRDFPDFVKAYEEDGMSVKDFESYGATRKTLSGFLAGYDELITIIRSFMLNK